MNGKLEKIINKVAKQRGEDPELVYEVIDKLFKTVSDAMRDYRYPEIRVTYLGVFKPRVTYVEDEIAKLLLKLKTTKTPTFLYKKILLLNNTSKRIRNENKRRKRAVFNKLAGGTK